MKNLPLLKSKVTLSNIVEYSPWTYIQELSIQRPRLSSEGMLTLVITVGTIQIVHPLMIELRVARCLEHMQYDFNMIRRIAYWTRQVHTTDPPKQ